jgi:hypothetical protein
MQNDIEYIGEMKRLDECRNEPMETIDAMPVNSDIDDLRF